MRLIGRIHLAAAMFLLPGMALGENSAPAPTLACGVAHTDMGEPEGHSDWDSLSPVEIEALAETWRAQQRARSDWTTRIAPYYSVRGEDRASLYLMNGFADPIDVSVVANNPRGGEYPLGSFKLRPQSHTEIDLDEALVGADPSFATGSLRATFFGDPTMVLGWVMQRRRTAIVNIPLQAVAAHQGVHESAIYSYWSQDLLPPEGGEPGFYVANSGTSPVEFTATFTVGGARVAGATTILAPSSVRILTPPSGPAPASGYVEIRPIVGDEAPAVMGLVQGSDTLIALPTFQVSGENLDVEYVSTEARLKGERSEPGASMSSRLTLSLFNPFRRAKTLQVFVVDPVTGDTIAELPVTVDALDIESRNLGSELATRALGPIPDTVRLRVTGESPFVPPAATVTTSRGEVAPVVFHKASAAHPFGRFAIPRLDENQVWTSIANLGDEPAVVAGQLFWEGGTFAIDPLTIAPGASGTFDFRTIVAEAKPDLLGRKPSGDLKGAYFHWALVSGPPTLIGRTYVRPNDALVPDIVMCEGCCFKIPWGTIIPAGHGGTIDFFPGQTRNATAAYEYTTCSGKLGP